jgi:hypothetical protein
MFLKLLARSRPRNDMADYAVEHNNVPGTQKIGVNEINEINEITNNLEHNQNFNPHSQTESNNYVQQLLQSPKEHWRAITALSLVLAISIIGLVVITPVVVVVLRNSDSQNASPVLNPSVSISSDQGR